ncbi:MAG: GNAT family N-acetyltransferase [Clostridiales bacterium]|nr:GNAT family N-acetyltransferase [Clostridiales bacterium]
MIEIKRLDKNNQQDFIEFNRVIADNLQNSKWFIPFSQENLLHTFDEGSSLVVYGAFVDGVLACISLFDMNWAEFEEVALAVGVDKKRKGAELGGCMVKPTFRGKNLMFEVNKALISVAKDMGIEYFVATAHPDNVASNRSLQKLGMEQKKTIIRCGEYLRNVYFLEL